MESKKYDITAIGECLIDFVSQSGDNGSLHYEGNAGGAPANVLACASGFGDRTAIFSKVGQDRFGDFLRNTLSDTGIDTSSLIMSKSHPTTLAFVSLDPTGNRSFRFYRKNTADVQLMSEELDLKKLADTQIFHFGSVSMTTQPVRGATDAAVRHAKQAGARVSFDPNLRELMWDDLNEAKEQILSGISYADFVKLSEEELLFLTGDTDLQHGMQKLSEAGSMTLLVVTLGPKGCLCLYGGKFYHEYAYDVPCMDTTGAGDAFWGMVLHFLVHHIPHTDQFSPEQIQNMLELANAAGSLATAKKGAIPALPTMAEVMDCINHTRKLIL